MLKGSGARQEMTDGESVLAVAVADNDSGVGKETRRLWEAKKGDKDDVEETAPCRRRR